VSDDRDLADPAEAIKSLRADLADMQATLLARAQRRPTGSVELAIRPTPQAGTLFLNGAVVSRVTYADLWGWANDVGAVVAGGFTIGDGTTTFGLPDFRGRVPVGVGTLGTDVYALGATGGAAARVLTTAQMPSHSHPLTGGGGDTSFDGNHIGHFPGSQVVVAAGGDYGVAPWNSSGNWSENHQHTVQTSVFSTAVGGGTAFDNRPAFLAVQFAIWT
jgi:microcystin-dependent protein